MRYIIAYRLKRKNARRRMYSKFDALTECESVEQFESYIKYRKTLEDTSSKIWELLTGDWKHICYWCEDCERATNEACNLCTRFDELKGIGKKNEGLS